MSDDEGRALLNTIEKLPQGHIFFAKMSDGSELCITKMI